MEFVRSGQKLKVTQKPLLLIAYLPSRLAAVEAQLAVELTELAVELTEPLRVTEVSEKTEVIYSSQTRTMTL